MKALAVIAALIVIACIVYLIFLAMQGGAKMLTTRATRGPEDWEVREKTRRGQTQLWLVKHGEEPVRFGQPVSEGLGEFEYLEALTERRIAARERCNTKNRRLDA